MAPSELRIQLCGRLVVRRTDRRVEDELPGRQGRLLFAYLVLNRTRLVPRDELVGAIWPAEPPSAPAVALRALLSKLRSCLGPDAVDGTAGVRLVLPAGTWIDVEAAQDAIHCAESAASQGEWHRAYGPGHVALYISQRTLLPGHDAPWLDAHRQQLEDLHLRALECCGTVQLRIGGAELPCAEQAARRLIEAAPFRESGYRLLMEVLAARDNTAEALRIYERLRCLLRDELGTIPGPGAQLIHEELLAQGAVRTP